MSNSLVALSVWGLVCTVRDRNTWKLKLSLATRASWKSPVPCCPSAVDRVNLYLLLFFLFLPRPSNVFSVRTAQSRRAASMPSHMKYILSRAGSRLSGTRGRKYFSCFMLAPKTLTVLLWLTELRSVSMERDLDVANLWVSSLFGTQTGMCYEILGTGVFLMEKMVYCSSSHTVGHRSQMGNISTPWDWYFMLSPSQVFYSSFLKTDFV